MCLAQAVSAENVRMALWHEGVTRDGPGLLLRDLQREEDAFDALAQGLRDADADIIVFTKFDFDAGGLALRAFADLIGDYPYQMPLRGNEGIPTGIDLDGDGRLGGRGDAQSYARFPGEGGLAVLSRFPIDEERVRSFNGLLWKDLPDTQISTSDPGFEVQKLSNGGHWIVSILVPSPVQPVTQLSFLIGHAGTPVFDGPEDRNGRRNRDELRLWQQILSGDHGPPPEGFVVFAADTNLDPDRGDGYRDAMAEFLAGPWFQDPLPQTPTANWENPGPMRVSYLLPAKSLVVTDARVWPVFPGHSHSLVTVDIAVPEPP